MTGRARTLIANNVRALRLARAMTQEDLAGAAEIDRSYVSLIENEHFSVSVDLLEKLAGALGAEIHELLMPGTAARVEAERKR
jgi:transcriptional regulator with XRE-family HTH domain